jgi:hypothetical protein
MTIPIPETPPEYDETAETARYPAMDMTLAEVLVSGPTRLSVVLDSGCR